MEDEEWEDYIPRVFGVAMDSTPGDGLYLFFIFSADWGPIRGHNKLKHLIERINYVLHHAQACTLTPDILQLYLARYHIRQISDLIE